MEKVKLTLYVPKDLADRTRNAVANLAGAPLFLSMGGLGEDALREVVERLEKDHNKGKPFPSPKGKRPGRPVGS